ncbi:hypothetical protein [Pusillimonas sp.]|uniref:hypothetical protein n=1 Tax=Pusillimonas sp. TaxID=3040095 RepID=UPI0037C68565
MKGGLLSLCAHSLSVCAHPGRLSCVGMLIGALIDAGQGGFVLMANLCAGAGTISLVDTVRLHWLCLPFMHAGMILGGIMGACFSMASQSALGAASKRLLPGLACSLWMLLGMNLGSYLWLHTGMRPTDAATTAIMLLGMAAGMQAWAWLNRFARRCPS